MAIDFAFIFLRSYSHPNARNTKTFQQAISEIIKSIRIVLKLAPIPTAE